MTVATNEIQGHFFVSYYDSVLDSIPSHLLLLSEKDLLEFPTIQTMLGKERYDYLKGYSNRIWKNGGTVVPLITSRFTDIQYKSLVFEYYEVCNKGLGADVISLFSSLHSNTSYLTLLNSLLAIKSGYSFILPYFLDEGVSSYAYGLQFASNFSTFLECLQGRGMPTSMANSFVLKNDSYTLPLKNSMVLRQDIRSFLTDWVSSIEESKGVEGAYLLTAEEVLWSVIGCNIIPKYTDPYTILASMRYSVSAIRSECMNWGLLWRSTSSS